MSAMEEPFNVTRPSGRQLVGTLLLPKRDEGIIRSGPCVVFFHGTLSDRNHNFVPDLCLKVVKDIGCATFRYDSRFGPSEEEPEHRYKFSGYADDVDDLKCVILSLQNEGFEVFCLVGHSRGANDVMLLAAEESANIIHAKDDSFIRPHLFDVHKFALVAAAPRFHMPRMLYTLFAEDQIAQLGTDVASFPWVTQRGELTVTKEDADVVLKGIDMATVLSNISADIPILLLHGTDDELIPLDDAKCFKEARPSIDLAVIDGARHAFRGKKQLKAFLTASSNFIRKQFDRFYSPTSVSAGNSA